MCAQTHSGALSASVGWRGVQHRPAAATATDAVHAAAHVSIFFCHSPEGTASCIWLHVDLYSSAQILPKSLQSLVCVVAAPSDVCLERCFAKHG